jgi:HSP20 family molecular chaperone IbpA
MALVGFSDDLWSPLFNNWPATAGALSQRGDNGLSLRNIPLDVVEKEKAFEIKADVPGVDKKDIKLNVEGDVLSLSVQKTQNKEDKKQDEKGGVKYHRTERSSMFVQRSLRLPESADLSKISAKYTDGVLQMEVPKSEEKTRTHNVQIE